MIKENVYLDDIENDTSVNMTNKYIAMFPRMSFYRKTWYVYVSMQGNKRI